jgi:nucleotide-binding universal stress UspA family protein
MYNQILLPLDGSSMAEQALPHAISIAKRFKSELILLRVPVPLPSPQTTVASSLFRAEKEAASFIREYMESIAANVQEQGITTQIVITKGRPHLQIIQYSENENVDLIVMCTRGQSGLNRWLMGSITDRVVRGANVPVLLIRAQKIEV